MSLDRLRPIDLSEAQGRAWDVIIAGSSFAAMFFRAGLPPGLSVLVIEKGALVSHDAMLSQGIPPGGGDFAQSNDSGLPKTWIAHTLFGGNSCCWWACTPRFHPNDFALRRLYGVGEDWPFGYETLAPYYNRVEEIMEVSGGGSDHILPRDRPFPFPPHIPSRSDRLLRARSRNWFAQPTARSNGGRRTICCANGVCTLCPVDSKFTLLNAGADFLPDALPILTGAEVRAVRIEAGRATGIMLRHAGRETELRAGLVALGTNAVFNAAILLRSGLDLPGIGRGLNEQLSRYIDIDAPGLGPFGGTSITGHGYDLYDGPHRARHSGVLLELFNAPPAVRPEPGRWLERARIKIIVEDLPNPENRVILQDDEPLLVWKGHSRYAHDALDWAVARVPELFDGVERATPGEIAPTEAHILGTHAMGADPARHVTDDTLRCHGVPNLHVLGGGAFPTISMANPTLTIAAMSLKSAESVT